MHTPRGTRAAIFGCAGPRLTADEAAFFADARPWGFILFARNIETPAQVAALCAGLREAVGWDAPILIDQEGGRVARLPSPPWRAWAPALEMCAHPQAPRLMWLRARLIADELRALGIDTNCTPLADVAQPDTHPVLRNRTYGTDPARVAQIARANADGTLHGGVLPVLKHIPGHGRARLDSHLALPRTDAPLAQLEATDFAPFRALYDLPLGMTAHVVYAALDPDRPATQSPEVIGHIRARLGFAGLLMTDDLSMQALSGAVASRARASLAAGCDLILHCNGAPQEMAQIAAEVPALSHTQRARADAALALRQPQPIDIDALAAEFKAILAAGDDGKRDL